MTAKKPDYGNQYREWLRREHQVNVDMTLKTHFDSVTGLIRRKFQVSAFWMQLRDRIRSINSSYMVDKGLPLFRVLDLPDLLQKEFESFLLKTYRKNVANNDRWPAPPGQEWLLPPKWLSRIDDTVRTLFVVTYLDGVQYFQKELCRLGHSCGLRTSYNLEARPEGYYAAHVYIYDTYEVPDLYFGSNTMTIGVELQVTTQVQELVRSLLHKIYEVRRVQYTPPRDKWQWDFTSDEFSVNYLAHMLHYLEGTIVRIRDKRSEDTADGTEIHRIPDSHPD